MAVIGGPDIIEDGIFAHWDAANMDSYPRTGDTWYDLSGNNHHAYGTPGTSGAGFNDLYFPDWESSNQGIFNFNGNHGLTILTDLGYHADFTTDFWCYKIGNNLSTYFFDSRNTGTMWWLSNENSYNINVFNRLRANDPTTFSSTSNWWDRWINIVITSTASVSTLWINGEPILAPYLNADSFIEGTFGQYFRIGNRYTGGNRWIGYFSNIKFYNKVLNDLEIKQNYNALKGRYQ